MSDDFALDVRIEADSLLLGSTGLCEVRLMNDARWPWILLIPRRTGVSELHELAYNDARRLHEQSRSLAGLMREAYPSHRMNVAALGNVVHQLHLHHVLRCENDPAWPGPVWGFGERTPHTREAADEAVAAWRKRLQSLLNPR